MIQASPVLYPSSEFQGQVEVPTLVWRQEVLTIPARMPAELRLFSIDPVIELCIEGRLIGVPGVRNGVNLRPEGTDIRTADVLGVGRQRVCRWRNSGLASGQARVIAMMFGIHPSLIWSDWFGHAQSEAGSAGQQVAI